MKNYKIISKDKLRKFFDLLNKQTELLAPKKINDKHYFAKVKSFDEISLDYIQTSMSAKSAVFPKSETLMTYKYIDKIYILEDIKPPEKNIVVFGAKPCDAATFDYLHEFFLRENPDKNVGQRLQKLYVVTLACNSFDDYCFCTSVGKSPNDTTGSDLVLTPLENESYYIEVVTDKGEELISLAKDLFVQTQEIDKSKYTANVPKKFNSENISEKLSQIFDNPLWLKESLACLSCGTCAYVCPTCTCFDIQDEGTYKSGSRIRTWDSCAFKVFTLHAGGHNPRSVQSQRWRNRLKHKFEYSVKNLGVISCVGCGRCARNCPGSMNIIEKISLIAEV